MKHFVNNKKQFYEKIFLTFSFLMMAIAVFAKHELTVNTSCGIKVIVTYPGVLTRDEIRANALKIDKDFCGDKYVVITEIN